MASRRLTHGVVIRAYTVPAALGLVTCVRSTSILAAKPAIFVTLILLSDTTASVPSDIADVH